ncbi:MAG: PIG-L family deacetylase [bacterium]
MRPVRPPFLAALLLVLHAAHAPMRAQDAGAARLHALVTGLTVTPRVLLIGARPVDADADLIAWLARGHHVQTGFLSLTRGESSPNATGLESGPTLGAIHVQEALAARRIDGGEQYFTRAYDFGLARNAADAFARWNHTTLLGEVVLVVRAFRPHVIVARFRADSTVDRDGQHEASAELAREVFDAAGDTVRFPVKAFGMPWTPLSLYEPGPGVAIDAHDYDPVSGHSAAEVATLSRAQLRSFGFATPPWQMQSNEQWRRIATRVADTTAGSTAPSLFAGIDTSFARLQRDLPIEGGRRPLITQLPALLAAADSARAALDLEHPATMVPFLKRTVDLASAARVLLRSCRHPARDAAASVSNTRCQAQWLDLDASLDLVLRRAGDALLAASGITVDAVADREFLATGDTATVTVTVTNHGDAPARLNDASVTGGVSVRMTEPVTVPAHGSARLERLVTHAAYAHPWWLWQRDSSFYPPVTAALDGVSRPALFIRDFTIGGSAIPEGIRRIVDATVTITMGMTTLTSSVGAVVARSADPTLGMQDRALSGVPPVTVEFERALEWAQAGKPLKKQVRVALRSFSDVPRRFTLKPASGAGAVKVDSLPPSLTLAPHEARDVTIQLRGTPAPRRYDLGLAGIATPDTFEVGFRTAQYTYIPVVHFFRESMVSVQAVDVEIPPRLTVAYVRGAGDDADVALKQLGVPTYVVNAEGLARFDLAGISTVVLGPDAFRTDHALLSMMPRLTDFARKGGTLLVLANPDAAAQAGVLPYPVRYATPITEQLAREDGGVGMVDARARLLTWPNVIRGDDWQGWVGPRALTVPTTADPRYATVIETHDPNQPPNRNSILVGTVGKGRVVYTSLTVTQQIANAVPGAMRLFVNLLSAGLAADSRSIAPDTVAK